MSTSLWGSLRRPRLVVAALGALAILLDGCRSAQPRIPPVMTAAMPAIDTASPTAKLSATSSDCGPQDPSPAATFPMSAMTAGEAEAKSLADANRDAPGLPGVPEEAAPTSTAAAGEIALVQAVSEPTAPAAQEAATPLGLNEVMQSVEVGYPVIQAALQEIEIAAGRVLASWGEFDTVLAASSLSQPLGYYENYRQLAGVVQPLWSGGKFIGGYRLGDGSFAPWYGERETNEGGEFNAAVAIPLNKDRQIDSRRAGLFTAEAERDQVTASVEARLLQIQRYATQAYWEWVAAGNAVQVQLQLLALAEKRVTQISQRVAEGDLPEIAQIDNDRFIAKRRVELIKARRYLQKTTISLSLFYRDAEQSPQLVSDTRLPAEWPTATPLAPSAVQDGISQALQLRPELRELAAARESATISLRTAQNLLLSKVDFLGGASKDVGAAANPKLDKTPLELEVGLAAEVPYQRREGAGKLRAAQAKLAEIDAKQRFARDKITAEVQDAASAVNAAHAAIEQAWQNVQLNLRSQELAELAFDEGDIDMIELNIYETNVADAELQWIAAQAEYWIQVVVYQTSIRGTAFE